MSTDSWPWRKLSAFALIVGGLGVFAYHLFSLSVYSPYPEMVGPMASYTHGERLGVAVGAALVTAGVLLWRWPRA